MYKNYTTSSLSLSEIIYDWKNLSNLFEKCNNSLSKDRLLPQIVFRSIGNAKTTEDIDFISQSLACVQQSIILVDDILDEDPKGIHIDIGVGEASNLALTLQSIACSIIQESNIKTDLANKIIAELNNLQLITAYGQHLDYQITQTEKDYWNVVENKSRPFYQSALKLGALLANAPNNTLRQIEILGGLFGEIVQLNDDIKDAFEIPANPDWALQGNNLLIIYACTASYPEKNLFLELLPTSYSNQESLDSAQDILISSGSLSFTAYQIIERYNSALKLIEFMNIKNPDILTELFNELVEPLIVELDHVGFKGELVS